MMDITKQPQCPDEQHPRGSLLLFTILTSLSIGATLLIIAANRGIYQ